MDPSEEDIEICQKAFADFDEDDLGMIKATDLKTALERININPQAFDLYKMISEVDANNTGYIKFSDFLSIYFKNKNAGLENNDDDLLDVFVSLGGNEDKSGNIEASKLIKIIKHEFNMTIDIEKLIKDVDTDGSGEIEFDEFK